MVLLLRKATVVISAVYIYASNSLKYMSVFVLYALSSLSQRLLLQTRNCHAKVLSIEISCECVLYKIFTYFPIITVVDRSNWGKTEEISVQMFHVFHNKLSIWA